MDENNLAQSPVPAHQTLQRALLLHESRGGHSSHELIAAARRVWGNLRTYMEKTFGSTASEALFKRALALSTKVCPWLEEIQLTGDAPEGEFPCPTGLNDAELMDGLATLLSKFMELLEALIGAELTTRLIQRIWPELKLDRSGFTRKEVQE